MIEGSAIIDAASAGAVVDCRHFLYKSEARDWCGKLRRCSFRLATSSALDFVMANVSWRMVLVDLIASLRNATA